MPGIRQINEKQNLLWLTATFEITPAEYLPAPTKKASLTQSSF